MIDHVILPGTLSCLSVKTHLHCFDKRQQEIQLFSTVLQVARIEVTLATTCLANLLRAFTSPIVGEAAFEAHLENLKRHWNCVLLLQPIFSVRESFYTLCALQEAQWRSSFGVLVRL